MLPLEDWCSTALARPAGQPAIEFEHRWFSWGELRQLADQLGELLEASGAATDAPVAFVPRNHPSAIAALIALLAKRRTVRMIYAFQSPAAIARDVERLHPAILVAASEDCKVPVLNVLHSRGIAGIALSGMDAAALPTFERSRANDAASHGAPPRIEILTSGTTGPPKQFGISYELIAKHFLGSPGGDLSSLPPTLLCFPLGNISGIYSTLPPLLKGQRAVLLERFSVAGWHDYLLRYRPAASGLPPAGVQMVLDANIPPEDLSCLRRLGTGAAPLDPTVHRAFEERYCVPILLSYGATEFGGPVTAMTAELHADWGSRKFGSVGRALPGAQLRVIDPDTGDCLPPGQEGVLEVISPRIGADWIRTSDVAVIDEDGFLFHRGRNDGAIMRGGFKILPETIERALMLHPAISAAAVIGINDARLGQVPAAAIQFKRGMQPPDAAQLEAHLRQHLPSTHVPAHWRFVEAMPRTPSLKVERPGLRRLFEPGSD
ncbi:MAG TPA: fatty acid--CoA ligase family protein [Solimonas sp.]|nr:fatty acid--CoA ligase family protein [Solimonas sp.]